MFERNLSRSREDSDTPHNFDLIKIGIASPEVIESWSYGEVTKPETINYRTFKPERGGLFCSRIFGPVKDYECLCGKYKRLKNKGVVCHKCGVEVTVSRVRRERMGHITLAAPVVHVWFLRSAPSRIGSLLGMSMKDLERILYFESYVIVDSGSTNLKVYTLLTEQELFEAQDQFGMDSFTAAIGGEAIEILLKNLDLKKLLESLREELANCGSELKRKKIIRSLKIVDNFVESNNKPEWMMIKVLPVLPPQLRPLVPLEGGRFATSDLNDLYRRVLNRNNRLKRLLDLKAPDIIVRNEKRMLQEAVDALLDNSRGDKILKGAGRRPLKSIADMLKGKHGRFRQNLLGKRVDYSGRSVIVVGPKLKLHQCGIPKRMALELFKPFVYARLVGYGLASTIKAAKKMVESAKPEVWDILEEVICEHPVLLNRAPTLHRLGIQAFEPILTEDQAIHLHPLVCTAFNADFDGDQMAVHIPLSIEAQVESRVLMMSSNNILSAANGSPVTVPDQDIVLGLYYMTMSIASESLKIFGSVEEIEYAMQFEANLGLHTKILYRMKDAEGKNSLVETTLGRLYLFNILPDHPEIPFSLVNKLVSKKDISNLVQVVHRCCGPKATVMFLDHVMTLGFKYSCQSGISWGMDDMVVPQSRRGYIDETQKEVGEFESQYNDGLITQGEKYNKTLDAWSQCTERVTDALMHTIEFKDGAISSTHEANSVYIMADSGARGSVAQIKQISGMRGLMAKPSGEIMETPIISNFRDGLTVFEYFNSTHGARKGLADTALKTANSGYLTRRLVDVSLDCVVTKDDCGTDNGLLIRNLFSDGRIIISLEERILGRVVAQDIFDARGNLVISKGGVLEGHHLPVLSEAGVQNVKVRSVLTCQNTKGVCAACYGKDLSTGRLVSVGSAVGVIAAQSIGEPGTQLTMRTFHIGGAATRSVEASSLESSVAGKLHVEDGQWSINSLGQKVIVNRSCEIFITSNEGKELARYRTPYGSVLLKNSGDRIEVGDKLSEWDAYTIPIVADSEGVVSFVDIIEGVTIRSTTDLDTGVSKKVVIETRGSASFAPRVEIHASIAAKRTAVSYIPINSVLLVENGELIKAGDVLARVPKESTKTRDITGGLPRIAEIFEARKPKDFSLMAEFDGVIEFGKDYRSKRTVILRREDGVGEIEYVVPKDRYIAVTDGEIVRRGDVIVDGQPVLQDILRIKGVEALAEYMVSEIQSVFRLQGVKVDDKHVEIVIKQMLQKIQITDPGDTTFFAEERVDCKEFDIANAKMLSRGLRPSKGQVVISGITKAATQTSSFISAAAFQETTRVLTDAATSERVDELESIKESVITGRLIPAGTGFFIRNLKNIEQDFVE
jgi:DNA-directed RNA polymerase subunit beta'